MAGVAPEGVVTLSVLPVILVNTPVAPVTVTPEIVVNVAVTPVIVVPVNDVKVPVVAELVDIFRVDALADSRQYF